VGVADGVAVAVVVGDAAPVIVAVGVAVAVEVCDAIGVFVTVGVLVVVAVPTAAANGSVTQCVVRFTASAGHWVNGPPVGESVNLKQNGPAPGHVLGRLQPPAAGFGRQIFPPV
jgi:hypothetical protein